MSPTWKELDSQLLAEGGFFSDRYFQLAYKSASPTRMQMGVIVLCLTPDGNALTGYYAGFSPTRDAFVMGNVTLARSNP